MRDFVHHSIGSDALFSMFILRDNDKLMDLEMYLWR